MLQAIEIETPLYGEEADITKTWKRQSDLLRPLIPLTKDTQTVILEYLQPRVEYKKAHYKDTDTIEITFCDDSYINFTLYAENMPDTHIMGVLFEPCIDNAWIIIRTMSETAIYTYETTAVKKYKVSYLNGSPLFENSDFKILIKDKPLVWKDNDWQSV